MADRKLAPATGSQSRPSRRAVPAAVRWGVAALIALSAAAITAETRNGGQRLEIALERAHDPTRFLMPVAQPVPANAVEMARLSTIVRELSADRDRLKDRIASLQQRLDETTGSITRQVQEVAAAAKSAAKHRPPISTNSAESIRAEAPPASNAGTSIAVPLISVPKFTLAPAPPYGSASTQWSSDFVVPTERAVPAQRVASTHTQAARVDAPAVTKDFAIELGTGISPAALWDHWVNVKASFGPLLTGLEPHYRRYRHEAGAAKYQLIAGPLADAAAANRLCSILATVHVDCQTTTFDGSRLTIQ
jgi:hypothetical protein